MGNDLWFDNDTPALNALKALRGAPTSMGRGETPVELQPAAIHLSVLFVVIMRTKPEYKSITRVRCCHMRIKDLEELSRMDITSESRKNLVDIRSVKVDSFAPLEIRINGFFNQIKNPYCFLYDSTPVRISFSDENHTLQERLNRYFVSRKQG